MAPSVSVTGGPALQPVDDVPAPVLVRGVWHPSQGDDTFVKHSPVDGSKMGTYPVSPWNEIVQALEHAWDVYELLTTAEPERLAGFLERLATSIDNESAELVDLAAMETALSVSRLRDIELPRTTFQLRAIAGVCRDRTWTLPTLSPESRIASLFAPMPGAIIVFGPNNFPFAFNAACGGDFAAAVATGHPVIAKVNPGHPETSRRLAQLAHDAALKSELPAGILQLLYRTSHEDGLRLVADDSVAATAYTGSRRAGLALKSAADGAGRPIYVELSSINPVVVLVGALRIRGHEIAEELRNSMLQGTGQFCTSPGLLIVPSGEEGDLFVQLLGDLLVGAKVGPLLDGGVRERLESTRDLWRTAGAKVVKQGPLTKYESQYPTTLMSAEQETFLASPEHLQEEAFGNMALVVRYNGEDGLVLILEALSGNLTGSIYSDQGGSDDLAYAAAARVLRRKVGRLLNDKAPTGVAVVAGMNHGGPFPATGHPGFTAVGMPSSLRRFAALHCFDTVRPHRLPAELQPHNPLGIQRFVNGEWTRAPVDW